MKRDDRTQEELLGEVIALLAEACRSEWPRDADARADVTEGIGRPGRLARRLRLAEPMRVTAADLARCVQARDEAGVDRMLSCRRTQPEWRRLALILAASADLEHLVASAALAGAA